MRGHHGDARKCGGLTPAQQVVPDQVLLLGEHGHHDERVQVDPLAQHPEVVTAQQVEVDEHEQLTAGLREHTGHHLALRLMATCGRRHALTMSL